MTSIFVPTLLQDKVAIITGGATGICFGLTAAFIQHGCKVCIASRKEEALKKALNELNNHQNLTYFVCDVRNYQKVADMVKFVQDKWEKVDILVNGAAGNFLVPFDKMSQNAFKTVMEIDAFGTFNCCRALVAANMKNGVILNISATLQLTGVALQLHAGAAKAAVDAMTRHLAVELGPRNIRVVGIAPGPIADTEGIRKLSTDELNDSLISNIPLQKLGKIEDIAQWALFVVSSGASFFTGQTVIVDGGVIHTLGNQTFQNKEIRNYLKSKL